MDEKISIFFVDKFQMNILREDFIDGLFMPSIWSCLKACTTIPDCRLFPDKIMVILDRIILCRIQTIQYSRSGDIKKVVKLSLGHTIVVLFGKADIDTGATLAHEMTHAWFQLKGTLCCDKSTEEGICEVMSYKWLEWFCSSHLDNSHKTNQQIQYTRQLKEILVEEKWCRGDEVYGLGFIGAMRAIDTFGFQTTLNHAAKHGTLPLSPPLTDSTCSVAISTATAATSITKSI